MTTIEDIRTALTSALNDLAGQYGEDDPLTPAENTTVTDTLAEQLETLNPNHNYPPTNK